VSRKKFAPRRIVLGVDDLDLVKGSLLKVQAYNRFLHMHPDKKDEIVLVQILNGSSNSPAEQKHVRDTSKSERESAPLPMTPRRRLLMLYPPLLAPRLS
jgi:trehalose-6-phosphate synthase